MRASKAGLRVEDVASREACIEPPVMWYGVIDSDELSLEAGGHLGFSKSVEEQRI